MSKYRQGRVNDAVFREVSEILREVKDPRVSDVMITVTGAEVTADLKYAKIFYSAMIEDRAELEKGLKKAAGFVRSQLARRLNMRQTPEIMFVHDASIEHGAEISAILKNLDIDSADDEDETNGCDSGTENV